MTIPSDEALPYPSYDDPFPSGEEVRSWQDLPDEEMRRRSKRLEELRTEYYDKLYGPLVPDVNYGAGKAQFDRNAELNGMVEWARRQGLAPDGEEASS